MSFTWTQTIGVGSKSIKAALDEIRTNTDWLNNNRACLTHCGTHYGTHWYTHNSTYYSSNLSNYCSSVRTSHYVSYYPTNYSAYGGSCYPVGTKILLSNGRWLSIEEIRPNDEVMSFFGKANKVLDIYNTKLGKDRIIMSFPDNSLFFSPEEVLWARNDDDEYWAVSDYNKHIREEGFNYLINGKIYERRGFTVRKPILQLFELEYAHIDGWKRHIPIVRREFGDETPLFNLIVDGDSTYFVNGYITYGIINDVDIDFTQYKWNGLNKKVDNVSYLSDSLMIRKSEE